MSSLPPPTRQKILAATRSLLEDGDTKLRMSDIAKAAGVSRQALYLHFKTRADLLVATAQYVEQILDMDARLAPSRAATNGRARIAAFVVAWADWLPHVRNTLVTLRSMAPADPEAATALADRMAALRHGCAAAIHALAADGDLAPTWDEHAATDMFWAMLGFENWLLLTETCGWDRDTYVQRMTDLATHTFCDV